MKHIEDDKSFEITIGFITRRKYLKKAANKPCLECTKIRVLLELTLSQAGVPSK